MHYVLPLALSNTFRLFRSLISLIISLKKSFFKRDYWIYKKTYFSQVDLSPKFNFLRRKTNFVTGSGTATNAFDNDVHLNTHTHTKEHISKAFSFIKHVQLKGIT
jgi:hypothetical protein